MSDATTGGLRGRLDRALSALLTQSPELEAAAVVSFDGLPMASVLPADMDEERVAAMSAALLSLGERAAQGLGRGALAQVCIEGETGTVYLVRADEVAVLVAVAAQGAKAGLMRLELRRAAAAVADVLRVGSTPVLAPVGSAPVLGPVAAEPVLAPVAVSAPVLAPVAAEPVLAPVPSPPSDAFVPAHPAAPSLTAATNLPVLTAVPVMHSEAILAEPVHAAPVRVADLSAMSSVPPRTAGHGSVHGATAMLPEAVPMTALFEPDPDVNSNLLLRLIAGVKGL